MYGRGSLSGRIWASSEITPNASISVTLADAPNLEGASELKNGSYAFKANFEERWFFGGLMIGRDSLTEIPFKVKK